MSGRGRAEIVAVNPRSGPASIEGYFDEAMRVAGLLDIIRERPDADAVVIACFDDTGLDAARCLSARPVVGIGEAAFHMASLLSNRFSVVTTLARSVPAIEHDLARYRLAARCAGVRASNTPVLDLEEPESNAGARIGVEIARAIEED
jgi:allantoin racemase